MEVFYFIAAFLLVRRLYKSLKTSFILFPKWRNILQIASWGIAAVYIVNTIFFEDAVGDLVGSALLFDVGNSAEGATTTRIAIATCTAANTDGNRGSGLQGCS